MIEKSEVARGAVFEYNAWNGKTITPLYVPGFATVIATDGVDVHYITDTAPNRIEQTPIDRFCEIVKPMKAP